ncbi:DUF2165 domain-containing protein [Agromyces protaetiae]|uniref:DUF2165 domain-containing protein n=1 Tax=Agromyces protaetiae TaxID=2509455 RepID=A0A4P6FAU3_9MICO|nr:DUF2165 domain-containing protein [Agromyces protaetiae]QAY72073.1 DUF2165 domain-containing protein [Agromyces protaetiae]
MADEPRPRGVLALGTLPVAAAVLVGLNGFYLLLVAFGNITDFGTNQQFVQHVLSMDTTNFGQPEGTHLDPRIMWRAITDPGIQNAAYVVLIVWETLTTIVLVTAFVFWIVERGKGYRRARALSTIGLLMLILLFMGGFIDVGGEWFDMWMSTAWNGLAPAFQNSVLALFALVLVHIPNPAWAARES